MKLLALAASAAFLVSAAPLGAQTALAVQGAQQRALRQTLPLPPAIQAAYAAGTRAPNGRPGPAYWQQSVDYSIDAALDPASAILTGHETVVIHNTTPDTLRQVALRLYQNYFRPEVDRDDYVTDITDGMIIDSLSVDGAPVDVHGKDFRVNGTVAGLVTPAPVLPGADARLRISWHFEVPNVPLGERGERMGRWGKYLYQVAQWYPQVAMYDDLHGWRTDPYLGKAEFYNQFGAFDVRITLPAGWLIGATGTLQNPEQVLPQRVRDRLAAAMRTDSVVKVVTAAERGAGSATLGAPGQTLTWHFSAPRVGDFAFMASDSVVWDASHANAPNPVALNALYLPEHDHFHGALPLARFALEHHASFVMPYAFPQATDVDGPENGMEYPMIVFSGPGTGVLVHELGHEWFPMMVGSSETWYGWMDEGINEYIDAPAVADYTKRPLNRGSSGSAYLRIAGTELEAPLMWPANYAGPGYSIQSYVKLPLVLNALGGVVGDSAVQRALQEYATAWQWKHPSPWDFFNSFNTSLGRNLDWFWYPWFFTTEVFDQGVTGAESTGSALRVRVHDAGGVPMPIVLRVDFGDGSAQTVTEPVTVWADGSRDATVEVPTGGKQAVRVTLDPENRFQDVNREDNIRAVGR